MNRRRAFALCLVLILLSACGRAQTAQETYWPTEGWRTTAPEDQGMDSERLAEMLARVREGRILVDPRTVLPGEEEALLEALSALPN